MMLQNNFFAVYYLHGTFDSFLTGLGRKLSLNTQMPSKWSEREREGEAEHCKYISEGYRYSIGILPIYQQII